MAPLFSDHSRIDKTIALFGNGVGVTCTTGGQVGYQEFGIVVECGLMVGNQHHVAIVCRCDGCTPLPHCLHSSWWVGGWVDGWTKNSR